MDMITEEELLEYKRELKLAKQHRVPIYSSVKVWAKWKDESILIPKEDTKEVTHYLMDGGKMCVPDHMMDWFYRSYAKDILMHQLNFVTECRTPHFKMLMDMDMYDYAPKTYEELKPYLKVVQKAVSDFFPTASPFEKRMIVCTTDPTEGTVKNNKIFTKQGFGHFIWPDLVIDTELGLKIRLGCIQQLEKAFGQRHSENVWEDVVDKSVYTANGLRMIGSSKIGVCKTCKKSSKKMIGFRNDGYKDDNLVCDVCSGMVRYLIGRVYMVTDVLGEDGETLTEELEKIKTDYVYMVKQTSIRSRSKFTTDNVTPEWFDIFHYNFAEQEKKKVKFYKKNSANPHKISQDDLNGIKEHNIKGQVKDEHHTIWKTVQKLINDVMPEVYKNIEIMDIKLCSGTNNFTNLQSDYYLVRVNSSFCMNKADYHNSNTIYFVINEMGICQKCFCQCETTRGRFNTRCRDYHSEIRPFNNSDTIKILFPDSVIAQIDSWNRLQLSSYEIGKDKIKQQLKSNIQFCKDYILGKPAFETRFSSQKKQ